MGCGNSNDQDVVQRLNFRRGYLNDQPTDREQLKDIFTKFLSKQGPRFTKSLPQGVNYDWGKVPLDRVVKCKEHLLQLVDEKKLLQNAINIVEPWENVGHNNKKQSVRASTNIAYVAQSIADADCINYPLWEFGQTIDSDSVIDTVLRGYLTVFEGGNPDPYDPKTFTHPKCPREYIMEVYKKVLLNSKKARRCIFICLSHQLIASALVELLQDAVDALKKEENLAGLDKATQDTLKQLFLHVDEIGNSIQINKSGQKSVQGYRNITFPCFKNEKGEVKVKKLYAFKNPEKGGYLPDEVIDGYIQFSGKQVGAMEILLKESENIRITMFHNSEVNQEAIIFSGWAYGYIWNNIKSLKEQLSTSKLAWLYELPSGVEIIGSTVDQDGNILTEVANMRVDFVNDTGDFHPELFDDFSDITQGVPRNYDFLQNDDGIRMLVREILDE